MSRTRKNTKAKEKKLTTMPSNTLSSTKGNLKQTSTYPSTLMNWNNLYTKRAHLIRGITPHATSRATVINTRLTGFTFMPIHSYKCYFFFFFFFFLFLQHILILFPYEGRFKLQKLNRILIVCFNVQGYF